MLQLLRSGCSTFRFQPLTTYYHTIHRAYTPLTHSPPWPIHLPQQSIPSRISALMVTERSIHTIRPCMSITGISFSPVPPAELKVAQWLKSQEILARRKHAHSVASSIWLQHPSEDWSQLTRERSEALLRQHAPDSDPSEWDINEFLHHTLQQKCPWRHAELLRERKAFFESCLEKVMKDLRHESANYKFGTMQMTKNELTRKLTAAMGGRLPSAAEVDDAWQDRHTIPSIDWMEDTI